MTQVVTYKLAYAPGTVSLCEAHAANPPEDTFALGEVSHGQHEGTCDACTAREYVVALTPFPHQGTTNLGPTETGPFTARAEAERTLRGAMATGRFASGTIVSREKGAES